MEEQSYFSIIPAEVIYSTEVSPNAKLIYGTLAGLSKASGFAYASNGTLAEWYQTSVRSISRWVSELENAGFIRTEDFDNNGRIQRRIFINNLLNTPLDKNVQGGRQNFPPPTTKMSSPLDKNVHHINKTINKTNNKNIMSGKPDQVDSKLGQIKEIIDYLNTVTGSSYKYKTKKTKDLITTRLNEGFSVDDFKKAIDNKNRDWGNDDRMSEFLRPETLFSNKFEGYLNRKQVKRNGEQRNYDNYVQQLQQMAN